MFFLPMSYLLLIHPVSLSLPITCLFLTPPSPNPLPYIPNPSPLPSLPPSSITFPFPILLPNPLPHPHTPPLPLPPPSTHPQTRQMTSCNIRSPSGVSPRASVCFTREDLRESPLSESPEESPFSERVLGRVRRVFGRVLLVRESWGESF